ncbi:unnamed protein product [Rhodiola kirilowii]
MPSSLLAKIYWRCGGASRRRMRWSHDCHGADDARCQDDDGRQW